MVDILEVIFAFVVNCDHWIVQFPQTYDVFVSSLFFLHPPPTISCMSLLVRSLPIDPVEVRPYAVSVGKGGTDIVKWLGETDPSVVPKQIYISQFVNIRSVYSKFWNVLIYVIP